MIRPLNPKAKTILKIGAVLPIITFILFIWANIRPVPIRVQITFTGFSNNTTTNGAFPKLANFCVSNAGKCSVIDEVGYYYETEKKKLPFSASDYSRGSKQKLITARCC